MLGILTWVIVGAIAGATAVTVVDKFWDKIAHWLNNTAADAVEKVLGPEARKNMHRAVSALNRVHDKIHHKSVVYAKQHATDSFFQKTTRHMEAPVYQIDAEIVEEIQKKGTLEQTFEYKQI